MIYIKYMACVAFGFLAPYLMADRPTLFLETTHQNLEIIIQSKILWNINTKHNTHCVVAENTSDNCQWEPIPSTVVKGKFNETITATYMLNAIPIQIKAFFPEQKSGRFLNQTTYTKLTVLVNHKPVVMLSNFGQPSIEFVVKQQDRLYCVPSVLSLKSQDTAIVLKITGVCSRRVFDEKRQRHLWNEKAFKWAQTIDAQNHTLITHQNH